MYAYTRNNPLKFIDPNGTDVTITAKNEEEAKKRFAIYQIGLNPEDRKHVHFFVGDGKNGYKKGQFYIKVDKDYQSESGNFKTIQQAANDRTAEGRITLVKKGDEVKLRNLDYRVGKTVLGPVVSFKFNNEFDGYTFFQYRGKDEGVGYSAGQYSEIYIKADQDDVELSASMHHELRAHLVLGDFGRNVPRAGHSDEYSRTQGRAPAITEADRVANEAEKEARDNAKKP